MIKGGTRDRCAPDVNKPNVYSADSVISGTSNHVYNSRGVTNIHREELVAGQVRTEADSELVLLAQGGDVAAYGKLVERHQRSVYGIVSRMVINRDDVDDIVQDVFVLAYRSIGSFKGQSSFSTWLHSIAVNTTLKQIKKMKIRQGYSIDDPDTGLENSLSSGSNPADEAERSDKNRQVRKAIDSLPDKHRAVVVLHYFEQYSCDEIAKILGCSVGTVWSRLHYACRKLKGQLEWIGG